MAHQAPRTSLPLSIPTEDAHLMEDASSQSRVSREAGWSQTERTGWLHPHAHRQLPTQQNTPVRLFRSKTCPVLLHPFFSAGLQRDADSPSFTDRLGLLRSGKQHLCGGSISGGFRSLLQCTKGVLARKLSGAGEEKTLQKPLLDSVFTSCWGSLGNKQLPRKIPF